MLELGQPGFFENLSMDFWPLGINTNLEGHECGVTDKKLKIFSRVAK